MLKAYSHACLCALLFSASLGCEEPEDDAEQSASNAPQDGNASQPGAVSGGDVAANGSASAASSGVGSETSSAGGSAGSATSGESTATTANDPGGSNAGGSSTTTGSSGTAGASTGASTGTTSGNWWDAFLGGSGAPAGTNTGGGDGASGSATGEVGNGSGSAGDTTGSGNWWDAFVGGGTGGGGGWTFGGGGSFCPVPSNWEAPANVGSGSDPYAAARQACVDTINELRATKSLAPLSAASAVQNACSDDGSKQDGQTRRAHGSAGLCCEVGMPGTQNTCPGWPVGGFSGNATLEDAIKRCLRQMWDEGEPPQGRAACEADVGGCFQAHGHYLNMTSPRNTVVSCGFFDMGGNTFWMNQNFGQPN